MHLLFAALALRGFACTFKRQYVVPITSETKHLVSPSACAAACAPYVGRRDGCSVVESVEDCDYVESSEQLVDKQSEEKKGPDEKPNGFVVCNMKLNPAACGAGRLPAAAPRELASRATTIGARLSSLADLEAAAVVAFAELEDDLLAHDAPRGLVERARLARADERRHARAMTELARAHGHRSQRRALAKAPVRSLEALAELNAVEGCVRETFGAFEALHAAAFAEDPIVRSVMRTIAFEELEHALLSWDVHAWARGRVAPAERKRIDDAMHASARSLEDAIGGQTDEAWQRMLGEPSAELRARAFELLEPLWS